jgi:hypothetical protein
MMVDAAQEAFFDFFPNTALQTDLKKLLSTSRNCASPRRNEIAHGVVEPYRTFIVSTVAGFCLGPSWYATNKRDLVDLNIGQGATLKTTEPRYLYSSVEIDRWGGQFRVLGAEASTLSYRLLRNGRGPSP